MHISMIIRLPVESQKFKERLSKVPEILNQPMSIDTAIMTLSMEFGVRPGKAREYLRIVTSYGSMKVEGDMIMPAVVKP